MTLSLLTQALATFRLTRLITEDTITEPLRDAIYARFGDPSQTRRREISLSYLVSCPYCASVYAAAATTLLAALTTRRAPLPIRLPAAFLLSTLALSGAVSAAHDFIPTPDSTNPAWS
jgi:hypothetical protein